MVSDRSNGIYRSIVIALVGLILVGTSEPPKQSGKPEQPKAERQQAKASPATTANAKPVEIVESSEYDRPCRQGGDNRNSDLCAQWKAADSAAEAAQWAWWQTLLSGLGIVGLLFSLYYTRKAVRAAEDATQDADRALEIAHRNADATAALVTVSEKTAAMQLRAYLAVSRIEPREETNSKGYAVKAWVSNDGQTPAKITSVNSAYYIGPYPQIDPRQLGPSQVPYIHFPPILNPKSSGFIFAAVLDDAEYEAFSQSGDDNALYLYGRFEYMDSFLNPHWLDYCYRICWGSRNLPELCTVCMVGNGAD